MRVRIFLVVGMAMICAHVSAIGQSQVRPSLEIVCGDFYRCLTDDDIRTAFMGKAMKYPHPGGTDFGNVTIQINADGTASGGNKKGPAGDGPWEIKGGVLTVKFNRWGDQAFRFVRFGNEQIFLHVFTGGRAFLVPLVVGE